MTNYDIHISLKNSEEDKEKLEKIKNAISKIMPSYADIDVGDIIVISNKKLEIVNINLGLSEDKNVTPGITLKEVE